MPASIMIAALTETLKALAAPADRQLAWDANGTVNPAELALDFDDAFRLVCDCPQIRLTSEQLARLRSLDAILEKMGAAESAAFWTPRAIRDSGEWAEVRAAAQRALASLAP